MHLVHTGLNGDATDGRLWDLVHATISIILMQPAPCSDDYENADFLQKMVDELGLSNANLQEMDLKNLLACRLFP